MQRTVICPGEFIVNNKIDAEAVGVYLPSGDGCFTSETGSVMLRRRKLYVHPFTQFVLQPRTRAQLLEGKELHMSGTNVGALVDGPLGHPADNENVYLPVANVSVMINYSKQGLGCLIEGVTHAGTRSAEIDSKLGPWSFKLSFQVPLAEYPVLFGLNVENLQRVQDLYAEAFGAS